MPYKVVTNLNLKTTYFTDNILRCPITILYYGSICIPIYEQENYLYIFPNIIQIESAREMFG